MAKDIKNRLSELEKQLYSDVWAIVTFSDGRTERKRLLDVINYCINKNSAPRITDISFIGDTSNQGVLPELLKYLVAEEKRRTCNS